VWLFTVGFRIQNIEVEKMNAMALKSLQKYSKRTSSHASHPSLHHASSKTLAASDQNHPADHSVSAATARRRSMLGTNLLEQPQAMPSSQTHQSVSAASSLERILSNPRIAAIYRLQRWLAISAAASRLVCEIIDSQHCLKLCVVSFRFLQR
jgi:hypothetical protein